MPYIRLWLWERFGFLFFSDIAGAMTELPRVLRPGGRISAAVWAEPPGNPWATIPLAAIGSEVQMPAPPPDAPGLFRCAALRAGFIEAPS
jgi:SAM-dependent methyltransferase